MIQIIDLSVTLTGTAIQLSTVAALAGVTRCCKVRIFPDTGNTHAAFVLGPNGNQVKWLNKPITDTPLDEFDWEIQDESNRIDPKQLQVNGTNGEKVNLTVFIG